MTQEQRHPIYKPRIGRLFTILMIVNIFTMLLGILAYGEKFNFWQFAYSYLGGTVTENGYPNLPSLLIFATGMIMSGFIMLFISANFRLDEKAMHHLFKSRLCLVGALGYFIIIYPYNVHNTIHSIGSALVFATLWGIASLLLVESRAIYSHAKYLVCMFFLQSTILTYAVTYVFGLDVMNVIQKAAVMSILIILKVATTVPRNVEEEDSLLQDGAR